MLWFKEHCSWRLRNTTVNLKPVSLLVCESCGDYAVSSCIKGRSKWNKYILFLIQFPYFSFLISLSETRDLPLSIENCIFQLFKKFRRKYPWYSDMTSWLRKQKKTRVHCLNVKNITIYLKKSCILKNNSRWYKNQIY